MRLVRNIAAILAAAGWASAADAGSVCTFDRVCVDDRPCAETDYQITFRAGTGGPNDIELDVGDEVVAIAVGGNAQVAHLAGLSQSGFHVLTLANGTGVARYTRHEDATLTATTWHGLCELGR